MSVRIRSSNHCLPNQNMHTHARTQTHATAQTSGTALPVQGGKYMSLLYSQVLHEEARMRNTKFSRMLIIFY